MIIMSSIFPLSFTFVGVLLKDKTTSPYYELKGGKMERERKKHKQNTIVLNL